ncbi:phosphatase PAP2 family protein [Leifsonia sp. NPDC102414]|uniref:phosphatase PAP2 family protein n=1 Tax=Leifsonia sp. NPDC102414 TaxID=3364124 RepID=UPI003804F37D
MNPRLFRLPQRWMSWAVALIALTLALGFSSKSVAFLRAEELDGVVNRMHSPLLDEVALVLDYLDRPIVVVCILLVLFAISFYWLRWNAIGVAVVPGLGWLTAVIIKSTVGETRPMMTHLEHQLPVAPMTSGFPSGHVVFAAAVVTVLVMVTPRRIVAATLLIGVAIVFVVAWSRMYLGLHFVSDVIGGILNGVAGALLFAGIWDWRIMRKVAANPRHQIEQP